MGGKSIRELNILRQKFLAGIDFGHLAEQGLSQDGYRGSNTNEVKWVRRNGKPHSECLRRTRLQKFHNKKCILDMEQGMQHSPMPGLPMRELSDMWNDREWGRGEQVVFCAQYG